MDPSQDKKLEEYQEELRTKAMTKKERTALLQKIWRLKHKEKFREYQKKYYLKNLEKEREKKRENYRQKEKIKKKIGRPKKYDESELDLS